MQLSNATSLLKGKRLKSSNCWTRVLLRASLLLWSLCALAVPPPRGVAPLIVPAGGFAIDGDVLANTPGANTGLRVGS